MKTFKATFMCWRKPLLVAATVVIVATGFRTHVLVALMLISEAQVMCRDGDAISVVLICAGPV
jgi:hypothetical protein